ncbi:MAG: hypothetical protein KIT31_42440 [Deltaproteobacteria bacterium]|nr:hypothetical protein [Deltaproteobacteria bacterium]
MTNQIEIGHQVFVQDGGEEFGAVRRVLEHGDLVVYVENAGDFVVGRDAIAAVHSGKVIVRADGLDAKLRAAIDHAHDAEEPGV